MKTHEEQIREVFARFGQAYCQSEILHRGLCIFYALATFNKAEDITHPRIEEKFVLAFSLTLGQVVEKTKHLFPGDLPKQLEVALSKRNYLAHHFWYERNPLMFSEQGLHELSQELMEINSLFVELDKQITEDLKPRFEAVGITEELIQESFDRIITGEQDELFISQRFPKKHERIVRVYDVEYGEKQKAQIFETQDGSLWQFCDVGLGWTRFEQPARDWKINKRLQKYLPADINPRPLIIEPWNYKFSLAKGAVLWVKRGRYERSYTWDIKEPSK